MKKFLNIFIWALLLFLITPSGMALASWNSTPGDTTYAWKLALEKVLLLIVSPSDKLQSTAQVKITERRFAEVEQTLESEYAIEGLENLNRQLAATSTDIQKIDKSVSRAEANEQYLASLKKMSATLNEQKTKAKTGQIAVVAQKTTSPTNSTGGTKTSGGSVGSAYNVYNIYNVRPTGSVAQVTPRPTAVVTNNNTGNTGGTTVVNNVTNVTNVTTTTTTTTNTVNNTVVNPIVNNTNVISALEETELNVNQTIAILEAIQANYENDDNESGNSTPPINVTSQPVIINNDDDNGEADKDNQAGKSNSNKNDDAVGETLNTLPVID